MKKNIVVIILSAFLLCGFANCSHNAKIKKVVTESLSKRMKNPDSFKVTSMEIIKDSVPLYLTDSIQNHLERLKYNMDERDKSYVSDDEKIMSSLAIEILKEFIKDESESIKPMVRDMALVNYTSKNGLGNDIARKALVIVNDEGNEPKIDAIFNVDQDLVRYMVYYKMIIGERFEKNEFGQYNTDNLSTIDAFIAGEQ